MFVRHSLEQLSHHRDFYGFVCCCDVKMIMSRWLVCMSELVEVCALLSYHNINQNIFLFFFSYPTVQLQLSSQGFGVFSMSRSSFVHLLTRFWQMLCCSDAFESFPKKIKNLWGESIEGVQMKMPALAVCRALRPLWAAASLQWQLMLALLWPRKPSIQSTPRSLSTLHRSEKPFHLQTSASTKPE